MTLVDNKFKTTIKEDTLAQPQPKITIYTPDENYSWREALKALVEKGEAKFERLIEPLYLEDILFPNGDEERFM
jgi:hypothetical protein